MAYPGDQGRPGGWSGQPSSAPLHTGPSRESGEAGEASEHTWRSAASSGGSGGAGESPFAPRPGAFAARPGESSGGEFDDAVGAPWDASGPSTPAWAEDAQGPGGPQPPPLFGPGQPVESVESGGPGGSARSDELYGAAGERYFAPAGPSAGGGYDAPPERRNNLPLIVGGALTAGLLLVVGGCGVSALLSDDKPAAAKAPASQSPPAKGPAATQPPQDQPRVKLRSRTTDPSPLTLKEIFGTRTFTEKGRKYTRTAWRLDKGCAKAVNGAAFAAALRKGGCNQVLRATFSRADGKLIGTIGVLNLRTEKAARTADKAGTGKDAYLSPLAGTGKTKKIGAGAAVGTTDVRGHYLILAWVQRPDGKTIPKKDYDLVKSFGQDVIVGSKLSTALNYRGYAGKPYTGKP